MEWSIVRLIWIAYYKCKKSKCTLAKLPKDILRYVIEFVGNRNIKLDENNINDCFQIKI